VPAYASGQAQSTGLQELWQVVNLRPIGNRPVEALRPAPAGFSGFANHFQRKSRHHRNRDRRERFGGVVLDRSGSGLAVDAPALVSKRGANRWRWGSGFACPARVSVPLS